MYLTNQRFLIEVLVFKLELKTGLHYTCFSQEYNKS